MMYFVKDIAPEKLTSWTGRYFRLALILKMFFFEICIVSLQLLPKAQITLIFCSQLALTALAVKAMFFDRMYNHKFFGVVDLVTELTLTLFLSLGMVGQFSNNTKQSDLMQKIQLIAIYVILFAAGLSLIQVVYNTVLTVIHFCEERKYIVRLTQKKEQSSSIRMPQAN
jgi:hypothetical protein